MLVRLYFLEDSGAEIYTYRYRYVHFSTRMGNVLLILHLYEHPITTHMCYCCVGLIDFPLGKICSTLLYIEKDSCVLMSMRPGGIHMRLRFVLGVVAFFLAISIVLSGVLFGPSLLSSLTSATTGHTSATGATVTGNAIVRENSQIGTTAWMIPAGKVATTQIQAYASATSVLPGKSITFYVSTKVNGTNYWIDIYRLGWYSGLGGHLMASTSLQSGYAQGYYDIATHHLIGCNTCVINTTTEAIEANWLPSYNLTVPSDWTTGIYLAKFTDVHGLQSYTPFDVLGNATADYVAVTPDTTYAAYNDWGGYSLYNPDNNGATSSGESDAILKARAVKVSFDRPYTSANGSSQVLVFEVNAVRWMEKQGYDVSYMSDIDMQQGQTQLLRHKAYISMGHDEYWTKEMYDAIEAARNQGVGLAFLGADAAYWQARLEPDSHGIPNRTVVCYKVISYHHDLARDPMYATDITRVTTQWRDDTLSRPENGLIGIMYANLTHKVNGFPWHVDPSAPSSLLAQAGLSQNEAYGCGLVGYEWDRVFVNGATPKTLHIIGTSMTQDDTGVSDQSNTTYYTAPSGAIVFASGSIYWSYALDNYRFQQDKNCSGRDTAVPSILKLMGIVMTALVTRQIP